MKGEYGGGGGPACVGFQSVVELGFFAGAASAA